MAQSGGKKVLSVSPAQAKAIFLEALELAQSAEEVPDEWLKRTRRVSKAISKSNTPILGTALLAKATNKQVNALALQTGVHRGYSARGVAKNVLVPLCVEHEIDLRTTGAEPLNNQPYFAKKMVVNTLIDENKPGRADLEYLIECLEAVDFLEGESAVHALAAFLRARIEDGNPATVLTIDADVLPLPVLGSLAKQFINSNREGGRRGQALVAACLDLVHPGMVYADAINDPSRKVPGDVAVEIPAPSQSAPQPELFEAGGPVETGPGDRIVVLSAEAKQKSVSQSEILQFVERLAAAGIGKGLYVAVEPNQADLESDWLAKKAQERNGVLLEVVSDPERLLTTAVQWSPLPLDQCLRTFPQLLVSRLKDFHCGQSSQHEWAEMLAGAAPEDQNP
ncbi:restriction endonuclease, SacI family [Kitasatospora mediocidica]|uniref:restriction endonuclease, SacI family n=1 Tax=Kitasatospora mediocidica TaxID=58352 RepID=UPI00055EF669|nr:restriction endonuclease, SacI family [Kitasatospora mediocidica]